MTGADADDIHAFNRDVDRQFAERRRCERVAAGATLATALVVALGVFAVGVAAGAVLALAYGRSS